MAADVAMNDMDIDFDMDAEMDPEIAKLQAEADAINARAQEADSEAMNGVEEMPEEGEVQATSIVPNKIHIRGLDKLNTFEIEQWAGNYYSTDLFKKVQWIDDSSANLIYDTEIAAAEALIALSAEDVADPLQLRVAKRIAANADIEIQLRQAIVADVKAPGAKTRSAYYLFNKQWDPDNPDNIRPDNRKRRWIDDERRDNKYRRRDYRADQQYRRGSGQAEEQFHEDMYGDDPKAGDDSRRNSQSSGSQIASRKVTFNQDLFANKSTGRLRNRSASPARDEDGRYGFNDDQPRRRTARARSPPPSNIRPGRDNHSARQNLRKELFPTRRSSTALTNGHTYDAVEAPSRYRRPSPKPARELFPDKANGALHRRQSAKELTPNEVADAIGKYTFDGVNERSTYSRPGRRPASSQGSGGGGKDLFSRISGDPKVESTHGRLRDRSQDEGFSIKGAGTVDGTEGFSILGASREQAQNPLVKELFPLKNGGGSGGGKDLFDGRIKGRGAQRRRAEDLW